MTAIPRNFSLPIPKNGSEKFHATHSEEILITLSKEFLVTNSREFLVTNSAENPEKMSTKFVENFRNFQRIVLLNQFLGISWERFQDSKNIFLSQNVIVVFDLTEVVMYFVYSDN